ncbi:hypothetical protein BGW41_006909 [Actinomortierella wolfii]|nr:hypothetical protein BGW41_006909 [Actinomortierella wolfii]
MTDLEDDVPPDNVLIRIIDHVNDLQTLFSLLTVSYQIFKIASRRLYRNPFRSAALATNNTHRVYGRLLEFLIDSLHSRDKRSDSTDEDSNDIIETLKTFRQRTTPASAQSHARIDYLAFVESMDGLPEYIASPKLGISMHWVERAIGLPWDNNLMNALSSLIAWGLGQHQQWRNIVDVIVPLYDLDRFASTMDKMLAVERIIFDMGQQVDRLDNTIRIDVMRRAVNFINQWESQRLARGNAALKAVAIVNLTSQELADEQIQALERSIYDMVVPCTDWFQEIHLGNWTQWRRLAVSDADYKAVQSIDLLSGAPSLSSLPSPSVLESILRRCRSLRSLAIACSSADAFKWAVHQPKHHGISLQHLIVQCDTPEHVRDIVEDALEAFGSTLCTASFHRTSPLNSCVAVSEVIDIDDPSFRHGPVIRFNSRWRLPNMTSLRISTRGMIYINLSQAFEYCPRLESLELEDDTPKYTPSEVATRATQWPNDGFPSLRHLVLRGYPAVLFSPVTLCAMRAQLTTLELQGTGWLGHERRFFIPPASDMRQARLEVWWGQGRQSWMSEVTQEKEEKQQQQQQQEKEGDHWQQFPNLQSLKLVGECALWFPLEVLAQEGAYPQLKTLTLDIGGHRFPSLMGNQTGLVDNNGETAQQSALGHDCHNTPLPLESLYLIGSWEVTDASLERLLHGLCPKLKLLVLQQARHYTNAELVTIAERHPTLERVVTSRYLRIRDTKQAGLELLPWPNKSNNGFGGSGDTCQAPTAAMLAQITGQKDLRCADNQDV